jgi:hypothetical protein
VPDRAGLRSRSGHLAVSVPAGSVHGERPVARPGAGQLRPGDHHRQSWNAARGTQERGSRHVTLPRRRARRAARCRCSVTRSCPERCSAAARFVARSGRSGSCEQRGRISGTVRRLAWPRWRSRCGARQRAAARRHAAARRAGRPRSRRCPRADRGRRPRLAGRGHGRAGTLRAGGGRRQQRRRGAADPQAALAAGTPTQGRQEPSAADAIVPKAGQVRLPEPPRVEPAPERSVSPHRAGDRSRRPGSQARAGGIEAAAGAAVSPPVMAQAQPRASGACSTFSAAAPPRSGWRAGSGAGASRMPPAPRSRRWPRWSTAR